MGLNEADARAKLIDPALHARGWTENLIRREETAGAIEIVDGNAQALKRPHCATYEMPDMGGEDGTANFLTRRYLPDYFTHIFVDECHRVGTKYRHILTRYWMNMS